MCTLWQKRFTERFYCNAMVLLVLLRLKYCRISLFLQRNLMEKLSKKFDEIQSIVVYDAFTNVIVFTFARCISNALRQYFCETPLWKARKTIDSEAFKELNSFADFCLSLKPIARVDKWGNISGIPRQLWCGHVLDELPNYKRLKRVFDVIFDDLPFAEVIPLHVTFGDRERRNDQYSHLTESIANELEAK